jgi:hypothetical protein
MGETENVFKTFSKGKSMDRTRRKCNYNIKVDLNGTMRGRDLELQDSELGRVEGFVDEGLESLQIVKGGDFHDSPF